MVASNNILAEIQNPKNWKRTHKKSYNVYMCRPLPGTQCTNRLEGSQYVTDQDRQFILSGTIGETWVIDVNKLAKTYTFADGTPITPDTLKARCEDDGQIEWVKLSTRADATPNWAFHLPKSIQNFPVQTSRGDTLYANRTGVGHLKGDFLVCADVGGQPNLNDVWVVNGEVFPRTYDLHAFPNMYDTTVTSCETVKPVQRFNKRSPISSKYDKLIFAIAKGLQAKGHKIGKIMTTEVLNKSFKVDNGLYGVLMTANEERGTALEVFGNINGRFETVLEFFYEDAGLEETIYRIHNVISGSRKTSEILNRAYNTVADTAYSVYVNGDDLDGYQDKQYSEKCKFAFKVINQTLASKGYSVCNTIGDFNECTVDDAQEIFRVNKGNMPNTVVCMSDVLMLFDEEFENILGQISLPDTNNKGDWKLAIQWITKGLSMR